MRNFIDLEFVHIFEATQAKGDTIHYTKQNSGRPYYNLFGIRCFGVACWGGALVERGAVSEAAGGGVEKVSVGPAAVLEAAGGGFVRSQRELGAQTGLARTQEG